MAKASTRIPKQSDRPVALITGASGGIGRACALALANAPEPFDLALQYWNRPADAHKLAAEIKAGGCVIAKTFQANLAISGEAEKMVDSVAANVGMPVAMIHAAGRIIEKPIGFTSLDDWYALMNVHSVSAAMLSKASLRYFRKSDRGRIVLIGSLAGLAGLGNGAAYAAAKGALDGLCKCLAIEAARWQTTVNVVAPGYVDTVMTRSHDADRRAANEAAIPLGRYATPDEIAGLVAFLCTRQAAFITGQTIVADGGMSLG